MERQKKIIKYKIITKNKTKKSTKSYILILSGWNAKPKKSQNTKLTQKNHKIQNHHKKKSTKSSILILLGWNGKTKKSQNTKLTKQKQKNQQQNTKKNTKTINKQMHILNGNIAKLKLINWNKGKSWSHNVIHEIQHIISEETPSIMALHEFNHRKIDDIDEVQINGYDLLLDDMYNTYDMARTAVYIKNYVKYVRRHDLEIKGEAIVAVTVHPTRSKPVNVISYYRQWQILKSESTVSNSNTEKAQKQRMEAIAKKMTKSISERESIFLSDTKY